jgi:hypothetical protein
MKMRTELNGYHIDIFSSCPEFRHDFATFHRYHRLFWQFTETHIKESDCFQLGAEGIDSTVPIV